MSAFRAGQSRSASAAGVEPGHVDFSPERPDDVAGLFTCHAADIFRYCASRVGHSAADDVVAETFLVAHQSWHRFAPERGTPVAWLFGIATNVLRRHRRDEMRALRALARTGIDPLVDEGIAERATDRVDASARSRQVSAALGALPTRQRDVLMLYAIAQLEYAEIAAALDIPLGSVQSALHRARTKVRAALAAGKEDSR